MTNQKEFEHVEKLVQLADKLRLHAADAVMLTKRMVELGILSNALEDSFVGATIASQLVGQLADAHLLAKAREVSTQTIQ